ncbi:hypothetical protein BDK51DRAFT_51455 [Blyttiomyces helicus]|uniref:Uncharacterized protein n=1 Tax=Blyttiomyces helicus TaxID=388810 RepID=A0A4P9WJX2_9FUNG|nr:hypothetical protein BDK51DRAFT_51455 [Blyttiomyces helicus]|eukprot:RKO93084.1 hypothetical protein BDK51DRAFT_51455 [Blyttiomyces helicus]
MNPPPQQQRWHAVNQEQWDPILPQPTKSQHPESLLFHDQLPYPHRDSTLPSVEERSQLPPIPPVSFNFDPQTPLGDWIWTQHSFSPSTFPDLPPPNFRLQNELETESPVLLMPLNVDTTSFKGFEDFGSEDIGDWKPSNAYLQRTPLLVPVDPLTHFDDLPNRVITEPAFGGASPGAPPSPAPSLPLVQSAPSPPAVPLPTVAPSTAPAHPFVNVYAHAPAPAPVHAHATATRPAAPPSKTPAKPRQLKGTVSLNESVACGACYERTAVLLLRGPQSSLDAPRHYDLVCLMCSAASPLNGASLESVEPAPASAKRKQREPGARTLIACDACSRQIGIGAMRVFADEGDAQKGRRCVEPAFEMEPVCAKCWDKYRLCSACGGGGKHRTGKWRPRELFKEGRKTCSLSHERLGKPIFEFEFRRSPSEISTSDLAAIETFWSGNYLSHYGQAREMEAYTGYESLPKLQDRISNAWLAAKAFMQAESTIGRRYVVLMWSTGTFKKKSSASSAASPSFPSAFSDTSSRSSTPSRSPSPSTPTSASPSPIASPSPSRRVTGFACVELDVNSGVLYASFTHFNPHSHSTIGSSYHKLLHGILADLRTNVPTPSPSPISAFFIPDRQRVGGPTGPRPVTSVLSWKGLEFIPLEEYVKKHSVPIEIFDPDRVVRLRDAGFDLLVAPFDEVLAWVDAVVRRGKPPPFPEARATPPDPFRPSLKGGIASHQSTPSPGVHGLDQVRAKSEGNRNMNWYIPEEGNAQNLVFVLRSCRGHGPIWSHRNYAEDSPFASPASNVSAETGGGGRAGGPMQEGEGNGGSLAI